MMRRPIAFRLAAGAIALWLALVLADAPALHPCPMHDVPGAGALAHGMPGMAAHAGHGAAHGSSPAHVHGCTCLGACGPGAAVLLVPAAAAVASAPLEATRTPAPSSSAPARGATSHFLPFAQAPPALV